jgi:pyruvate-ferredoxin/flavodoxin oxidoreductase
LPDNVKALLAKNKINFYIVDAISLARDIGLGRHTNTILQSAFFKLANIIPMEDAVKLMKDAAYKSFSRKGEKIVQMNYDAIDAGVNAVVKIDVPESWAELDENAVGCEGALYCNMCPGCGSGTNDEMLDHFVENILKPANTQKGDNIPVSAFKDVEDGTFPLGLSAFEKRGVAVDVPEWLSENCIQCNQCAYVCPHATIRAFAMDEQEVANAPEGMKMLKMMGKGCDQYKFAIAISPLDCMGCGLCANVCPAKNKALVMKPIDTQRHEQASFDYAVAEVSEKELPFAPTTLKGSQFKKPLLEFSGACAGCVESDYARILTQLFGDRMYIANATGCSSIWGASAPSIPYTTTKRGFGPAWANSLFEDNAEFGLGMAMAVKARRARLAEKVAALIEKEADGELKETAQAWLDNMQEADASRLHGDKLLAMAKESGREDLKFIIDDADMLTKKSIWIFGGDGWAYDIGFGGLDHVLASGEDINVFVFDTEVYSNTGGQASKASQIGQVAQFAASGKALAKKDLASIAMSYGYVYVAQVGIGADQNQTIRAMVEAEKYKGPSLIIGYAPCEMHGIRGGMGNSHATIKAAVAAGYWHLFRFDPAKKAEGKNPFTLDSKEPVASYTDFIKNETRYTTLQISFPDRAEALFNEAAEHAKEKYASLKRLVDYYAQDVQ